MKSRKLVLLTKLLVVSLMVSSMGGALVALETNDVWEINLPVNSSSTEHNRLYSVAASASNKVWTVGSYAAGYLPLLELWDGSQWTQYSGASATADSELYGLAIISPDIWAVGYEGASAQASDFPWETKPTSGASTYAEKYNNGTWTHYTTVSPGSGAFNTFTSVCGSSSSAVWAVGYYYDSSSAHFKTLAERWDGTNWSQYTTPNPTGADNDLYGVACVASDNVWAVGSTGSNTFIIHYNGTSWSQVTSPSPGTDLNYVQGVACYSSNECLAVGEKRNTGSAYYTTLALHYNGTSWSSVTSANPSSSHSNYLTSVAYVGQSSWAWAAGQYDVTPVKTLVEKWNGTSFSTFTSPNQGTSDNQLIGVSTIPGSSTCAGGGSWAVGDYKNSGILQTLAESYTITPGCSRP
jgi:hypothetical protein